MPVQQRPEAAFLPGEGRSLQLGACIGLSGAFLLPSTLRPSTRGISLLAPNPRAICHFACSSGLLRGAVVQSAVAPCLSVSHAPPWPAAPTHAPTRRPAGRVPGGAAGRGAGAGRGRGGCGRPCQARPPGAALLRALCGVPHRPAQPGGWCAAVGGRGPGGGGACVWRAGGDGRAGGAVRCCQVQAARQLSQHRVLWALPSRSAPLRRRLRLFTPHPCPRSCPRVGLCTRCWRIAPSWSSATCRACTRTRRAACLCRWVPGRGAGSVCTVASGGQHIWVDEGR